MRFASVSWTRSRFGWRFKRHFHRSHWKVSLFAHRQQDSKGCHVYNCAGFTAQWHRGYICLSAWEHVSWELGQNEAGFSTLSEKYAPMTIKGPEAWTDWTAPVFKLEAKNVIFGDVQISIFWQELQSLISYKSSCRWEESSLIPCHFTLPLQEEQDFNYSIKKNVHNWYSNCIQNTANHAALPLSQSVWIHEEAF